MTFSATIETSQDTVNISLSGELDANTAPIFKEKIEVAASQKPRQLVLRMENLNYMASAGLRMLIFAKQKMGIEVELLLVGANSKIVDTIEKTGFHHSVVLIDHQSVVYSEQQKTL